MIEDRLRDGREWQAGLRLWQADPVVALHGNNPVGRQCHDSARADAIAVHCDDQCAVKSVKRSHERIDRADGALAAGIIERGSHLRIHAAREMLARPGQDHTAFRPILAELFEHCDAFFHQFGVQRVAVGVGKRDDDCFAVRTGREIGHQSSSSCPPSAVHRASQSKTLRCHCTLFLPFRIQ